MVMGAGAIGAFTAAQLARADIPVTMVDPWFHHLEAVRRNGLRLVTPSEDVRVLVRTLHIDELDKSAPIDVAIVAVKSYDTEWAVRLVAPYMSDKGFVVSAQNGLNEERIARMVGPGKTVGCVVHMGGGLYEPGTVTSTIQPGWSAFSVGELDGRTSTRISLLAQILGTVGATHVTDDIWSALWTKLLLNVMSNGLSGLSGYSTTELWTDDVAVRAMVQLGGEAIQVAQLLDQKPNDIRPTGSPDPIRLESILLAYQGDSSALQDVAAAFRRSASRRIGTTEARASLLQDLLKGRRTEIDYLNGEIVRRGSDIGVSVSSNAQLVQLVKEVESGTRAIQPDNIALLDAAVGNPGG